MDREAYKQLQKLFQRQVDEIAIFYNALLDIAPDNKRSDILKAFNDDLQLSSARHKKVFEILNR